MTNEKQTQWIQFEICCGIVAAYQKNKNGIKVRLITHVPRGHYYSFLDEAGKIAEKMLQL